MHQAHIWEIIIQCYFYCDAADSLSDITGVKLIRPPLLSLAGTGAMLNVVFQFVICVLKVEPYELYCQLSYHEFMVSLCTPSTRYLVYLMKLFRLVQDLNFCPKRVSFIYGSSTILMSKGEGNHYIRTVEW